MGAELDPVVTLKKAKKVLKKSDGSKMKMKVLVKALANKLDKGEKEIKSFLKKSEDFTIDGKMVSFNRKSKDEAKKAEKRKLDNLDTESPKKKNRKSHTTSIEPKNLDEVIAWRKEHKIIIKDPPKNDETEKSEEKNSTIPDYFPFSSFESDRCEDILSSVLINHCTKTKKFEKPSPIQAQCWPVLLSSKDVVGIAETGEFINK